jgi:hypothetical protein
LERREVQFVNETMSIVLRQEVMRAPSQAIRDLRGFNLSHDVLFSIRTSLDKTIRTALNKAADTLGRALRPREFISEFVGEQLPSQKEIDAMERKKARANARRRVVRKA